MFDFDFSSKRARLALRFFTYGVMTVATIMISVILIFFALGYRLDNNFNFSQGGLVQFRSFPGDASVTIDGALQGFKTPGKSNLAAGHHTAEMNREGYQGWSKSFDLAPGQLLWLNYARLIPNNVETTPVREFDSMASMMVSPDRQWLLLQPKADGREFVLADISDEKKPEFKNIALPETQLTKKDDKLGTIKIIEWDLKSQYVLLEHKNGDIHEFIRLDRSKPDETVNLTKVFGLNIIEAHFSASNSNIVFANTSGVLRRLDIGSKNASGALVNNLKQFVVYGEASIAFTNEQELTSGDSTSKQQVLGVWRNDKQTTVRHYPLDAKVTFDYSEYDDHRYLAVGTADSPRVEILRDPGSDSGEEAASTVFAQFDLGAPIQWLSFSNNGRMVLAQNGATTASYDIEEAKSYQKKLEFGADITKQLLWLDDFYLWSDAGDRLQIVEFDGANPREITNAKPGYEIALSSNGKQLFSIGRNEQTGKVYLQSSKLVLEE